MKIAVLVKRVPDTASVFIIADSGRSVDLSGIKFVMSPYDEHAVEQAIRVKENNQAEVIVVSAGPPEAKDVIRSGLAMGADSGVLVTGEDLDELTPKNTARVLAAAVKELEPDVVFAGKQAVDDDAAQVPERVASLLDIPHVSVVTRFELQGDFAAVDREIEGGHYTFDVKLPALFTVDKALNTPRYPTLPNIMKAKRKPIEEKDLAALGLTPDSLSPGIEITAMALPRQERLGKILEGEIPEQVSELVRALREDEKIF